MTGNLEVLEISRCPRDQFLMDLKTFPVPGPAVDDRLGRAVAPRAVIGHCKEKLQDKVRRTQCRVGVRGGRGVSLGPIPGADESRRSEATTK